MKTINEFISSCKICPKCGNNMQGCQFLAYGGGPELGASRLTKDSPTIQLEKVWGCRDPNRVFQLSLDDNTCFGNYEKYQKCYLIVQISCHPDYECYGEEECCNNACSYYTDAKVTFDSSNYSIEGR